MSYFAAIDEDACAAHGDCADLAPEVFEVEDVARVIGTGPDELLLAAAELCPTTAIRIVGTGPDELLLAAAELCPTTAIRIVDQQTGEQVFP